MPNQFFSPEGDLENYFVTEYWLIDQYVGDTLWTWGRNTYGQLGTNSTVTMSCTAVTTFAGGTNWKQVSGGRDSAAAIKNDGTLWTWGGNDVIGSRGQLGVNDATSRTTPVTTFAGGTDWKQVSMGGNHAAAVKTDGTLWLWGDGNRGSLGINALGTPRCTPVTTFAGGTNWKQVNCGRFGHTAAIKTDGTLWTWGPNTYGQLGNGTTSDRCTPVQTSAGGTNWKQVSCGGYFTAAVKTDGTLWCWGRNNTGQIGNNGPTTSTYQDPVQTSAGGTNWKQVSCGDSHIAAIKTDGTLWIWGSNSNGAIGVNDTNNRCTPVTTFAGGTNWKQVASGSVGFSVAAIKTSDDLQGI